MTNQEVIKLLNLPNVTQVAETELTLSGSGGYVWTTTLTTCISQASRIFRYLFEDSYFPEDINQSYLFSYSPKSH